MKLSPIISFIHTRRLYLLPVGVVLFWLIAAIPERDLILFPAKDSPSVTAYNDVESKGNSRLEDFRTVDSCITIRYTLQNGIPYPFTGFKFAFNHKNGRKNLSSYDYVKLDISFTKQQNIDFFLHTEIPGYTTPGNAMSYRFLYRSLTFLQPRETCLVALKSLETPTWWYFRNNLKAKQLHKETFKKVSEIIIQSGSNNPLNESFEYSLNAISLHRDLQTRVMTSLLFITGWLAIYYLFTLLVQRKQMAEKRMVVSYQQLDVTNHRDECTQRVIDVIAKEYPNPDLSITQVARSAGVAPEKVSPLLQVTSQCNYKQYLNSIRITEAKRLLLTTDRNITEISHKVGYSNVTHFNRMFKLSEGTSPREFRNAAETTSD